MIDYVRAARQCRTQNEFNRLHIRLEERLPPREISAVASLPGELLPRATLRWLTKLSALSPDLLDRPKPFSRQRLSRHMIRYGGTDRHRGDKKVLVAFAGAARRLGMPISVFLQCLDADRWDLLLLQRLRHRSYFDGWDDGAPDLVAVVRHVREIGHVDTYEAASVLGSSNGGFPAVAAACLFNAAAAVAVSGTASEKAAEKITPLLATATNAPRLSFAHCADNEADGNSARLMRRILGRGDVLPVAGCAVHNVGVQIILAGHYSLFLDDVLSPDRAEGPRPWQKVTPAPKPSN